MKIFKELKKLGYKHYTEHTVEELDDLPLDSEERIMEQALVLRWFREKHKLYSPITDNGLGQYDFRVKHEWCGRVYDTYEEAESACLDKLIEICKTKTNEQAD